MIAYGCSITMDGTYRSCAEVGLGRALRPGDRVLAHAAVGSIARTYNLLLDEAAALDDLEALVLLHQDIELLDPRTPEIVREALADPDVAGAGPGGAVGARSIAWWDGEVTWASLVHRFGELGGGDLPAPSYDAMDGTVHREVGRVDTLYGVVLVLSPWAVRELRFDESLDQRLGYDFDLCQQARAAGRAVVTLPLAVAHHHALSLVHDPEAWAHAHARVAEKWDPEDEAGWKARARAAEGDAGGAKLLAASRMLQAYAHAQQHDDDLLAVTASLGWRMTRPLRDAGVRRAARRDAG